MSAMSLAFPSGSGNAPWLPGPFASAGAIALATATPACLALQLTPSSTAIQSLTALGLWGLALMVAAATGAGREAWWRGLLWGWLLVAVFNAGVGLVQVFVAPATDYWLLARSALPGRATGNVRQPNLLGTLLLWGAVAVVALGALSARRGALSRRRWVLMGSVLVLLVSVLVLSASRTALFLGLPVLVVWGLADRSLPKPWRVLLVATPAIALGAGWVLHGLAEWMGLGLGAEARLAQEGMQSTSRLQVWRETWALILAHPDGVGWHGFNKAWTLTPFPGRSPHFFDHTHNLPLQLIVTLGWLRGGVACALLLIGYGAATWQAWRAQGEEATCRRAAWAALSVVGAHSLMEYPLWYPVFLLPTLAAGVLCWLPEADASPTRAARTGWRAGWAALGLALMLGSAWAAWEYRQVSAIYAPSAGDARSLATRIAAGQRTFFFSRQADYAAATALGDGPAALAAAERTSLALIDTRLLMAWARSLHAAGQTDKARWLVARLREFRKPDGEAWLAECDTDPSLWQCQPPEGVYGWREF